MGLCEAIKKEAEMWEMYIQEASPLALPSRLQVRMAFENRKSYGAFLALCVVRTLDFAGWQLDTCEQDERQSSQ